MSTRSHYPDYDVLRERDHWDDHTRRIVLARLVRERGYAFFGPEEAECVRAVCARLVDDTRADILQFVVGHLDETLHRPVGEGQRKPGVPPAAELVREGLKRLNTAALDRRMKPFYQLPPDEQEQLLRAVGESRAEPAHVWEWFPQKAWFDKMLKLTLEAYYSHPTVWSEIGYGGPAYPRGYVRVRPGQLDPWEAKNTNG
jgi:hypothetical protein